MKLIESFTKTQLIEFENEVKRVVKHGITNEDELETIHDAWATGFPSFGSVLIKGNPGWCIDSMDMVTLVYKLIQLGCRK